MRRHNTAHAPSRGAMRVVDLNAEQAPPGEVEADVSPEEKARAAGWVKGQLLNVRNAGSHYNVTILGEEYDPRSPQRCIQFTNRAECQDFISNWYARESNTPFA